MTDYHLISRAGTRITLHDGDRPYVVCGPAPGTPTPTPVEDVKAGDLVVGVGRVVRVGKVESEES